MTEPPMFQTDIKAQQEYRAKEERKRSHPFEVKLFSRQAESSALTMVWEGRLQVMPERGMRFQPRRGTTTWVVDEVTFILDPEEIIVLVNPVNIS